MSFQMSVCHLAKIIVNQNEWELTQMGEGGGEILDSSSLLEN